MTDDRTMQNAQDEVALEAASHSDAELTDEDLDGVSGGNVSIGDISITKPTDKSSSTPLHT